MRLLLGMVLAATFAHAAKTLDVYFVDVEGGQATLIVTPSKESILVDTGWPGFNGRDAGRIQAAAKAAGVKKIDYLVLTHYHMDHAGGITQLVEKLPVKTFVDHGPNRETEQERRRTLGSVGQGRCYRSAPGCQTGRQAPAEGCRRTGRDCGR